MTLLVARTPKIHCHIEAKLKQRDNQAGKLVHAVVVGEMVSDDVGICAGELSTAESARRKPGT